MIHPNQYRYPGEQFTLFITLGIVAAILYIGTSIWLHALLVFAGLGLILTYFVNRARHAHLIASAKKVSAVSTPALSNLAQECVSILRPGPIELFVAPGSQLNAYAFGISGPNVVVLYSALFNHLDADEIRFVIGHEIGHICLGHTWINSLIGGMAGVPSTFLASAVFNAAFRWWNRACEYSADRAGLVACNNPSKAYSALIKLELVSRGFPLQTDLHEAFLAIQKNDQTFINELKEKMATHPRIYKRIIALSRFAGSKSFENLRLQLV